jgi:putative MFS transporter
VCLVRKCLWLCYRHVDPSFYHIMTDLFMVGLSKLEYKPAKTDSPRSASQPVVTSCIAGHHTESFADRFPGSLADRLDDRLNDGLVEVPPEQPDDSCISKGMTKIDPPMGASLDDILEKMPISTFHYRLLLLCGLVFMADGMEVALLTYMSTCAGDEWHLSDGERASIVSAVFAGEMCGSIFWGPFADMFGRRKGFLFASTVIFTAGFLSGVSPSYEWLLFFRTLVGFGVGGASVPFDLLSEFLPASYRGVYLTRMQYFWTIGSLFVTGVAWASLTDYGWRFLTYMTAIPVTLACLFSVYYLPESPRWLLVKGRVEEATVEVKNLAIACNVDLGTVTFSSESVDEPAKDPTYLDLFQSAQSRRVLFPLSIVWGLFGFTYYGIILFVSRLYSTSGADDDGTCNFDYSNVFINTSAEFIGVFVCVYLIDPLGRSKTQLSLYVVGGVTVALMGIKFSSSAVIAVGFIARLCIMGASSATWVATPELMPTEMRATGHSFCNTVARIGGFLTPFFVDNYTNSIGAVGVVLGILNIIAGLSAYAVPETVGKILF